MTIIAGQPRVWINNNAIGSLSKSETLNPFSPVEFGTAVATGTGIRTEVSNMDSDADGILPYAT